MPPLHPPLDEQDFDSPPTLLTLPSGSIDAHNNLFWYFTSSPFFEASSNNIAIFNAHAAHPGGEAVLNDRRLFEEKLGAVGTGVGFWTVAEPREGGTGAAGGEAGAGGKVGNWVIQRQNKVYSDETGRVETFVEGNYYTVGTRIMMAPSLLDVLRARLLTISTRMQAIATLSHSNTHWSPASGYSYYPPSLSATTSDRQPTVDATTRTHTPNPSLVPDPAAPTTTTAQDPTLTTPPSSTTQTLQDASTEQLLLHSLALTNAYGTEFMDQNPLQGEPGAFVFTNTRGAVDARNRAAEAAAAQIQQQQQQRQQQGRDQGQQVQGVMMKDEATGSAAGSMDVTPRPVGSGAGGGVHSRKGSVVGGTAGGMKREGGKRRQSKGPGSPVTPGAGFG